MRFGRGLVLGLLTIVLAGCASGKPTRPLGWLDRFRKGSLLAGPDVVQMDVALIERPFRDNYLGDDLWAEADEQAIGLEQKHLLEDNGFRIGVIGGITPMGLQALLTSDKANANPRRIQCHAGKPTKLLLGPPAQACNYEIRLTGGAPQPVQLEEAQCLVEVVLAPGPDGKTKIRFAPRVQHGKSALLPHPTPDLTGWMFKDQQPTEQYAPLEWEITIAPNDYIVIGGRFDHPDTLGYRCFIRPDEASPVQRLLVIRTGWSSTSQGTSLELPVLAADDVDVRTPPLARQAGQITVRGAKP